MARSQHLREGPEWLSGTILERAKGNPASAGPLPRAAWITRDRRLAFLLCGEYFLPLDTRYADLDSGRAPALTSTTQPYDGFHQRKAFTWPVRP